MTIWVCPGCGVSFNGLTAHECPHTVRSRWQLEFDALPPWARDLVEALKACVGTGVGTEDSPAGKFSARLYFDETAGTTLAGTALARAYDLAAALTAPWPPPPPAPHPTTTNNVVLALSEEENCAWDQPCHYGHRVEGHAVYCHCDHWPRHPRKCGRNRTTFRHEDCPGYARNKSAS